MAMATYHEKPPLQTRDFRIERALRAEQSFLTLSSRGSGEFEPRSLETSQTSLAAAVARANASILESEGRFDSDAPVQDWDGPFDQGNPKNWSLGKKIFHTAIPAFYGFGV